MTAPLPLRCACGNVRGELLDASAETGNRVVCYCDDCQAYARFLGREDILDAWGGTDIFQVRPPAMRITQGFEHLRVMRLSEKGLVRWYAACCRTPVGNMLASARSPFIGVAQSFTDHAADGVPRDARLGPPIGFIQGRFARGGCPPHAHPRATVGVMVKSAGWILARLLRGEHRPSPFFDAAGVLRATPQVLSPAERAALAAPTPAA